MLAACCWARLGVRVFLDGRSRREVSQRGRRVMEGVERRAVRGGVAEERKGGSDWERGQVRRLSLAQQQHRDARGTWPDELMQRRSRRRFRFDGIAFPAEEEEGERERGSGESRRRRVPEGRGSMRRPARGVGAHQVERARREGGGNARQRVRRESARAAEGDGMWGGWIAIGIQLIAAGEGGGSGAMRATGTTRGGGGRVGGSDGEGRAEGRPVRRTFRAAARAQQPRPGRRANRPCWAAPGPTSG